MSVFTHSNCACVCVEKSERRDRQSQASTFPECCFEICNLRSPPSLGETAALTLTFLRGREEAKKEGRTELSHSQK